MQLPDDLDSNSVKNNVIISINFQRIEDYEAVKDRLQDIADEMSATMAVKMA